MLLLVYGKNLGKNQKIFVLATKFNTSHFLPKTNYFQKALRKIKIKVKIFKFLTYTNHNTGF